MKNILTGFYPGWRVHSGAFVCALIVAGCTSYIFGLFVIPITEEFGISRAGANNGFIAFLIGVGVLSPLVGRLLDKFSARLVIASGGVMFGLGMIGLARTDSLLLMLLLILGPVSYGMAACGTLAANTVVVRWFNRRRGRALGILAVSTSAGGFIFAPFTAYMIENYGWRNALLVIGIIGIGVIGFAALFLLRNHPAGSETGYDREFSTTENSRDGVDGKSSVKAAEREWTYGELLRNRNFWCLTLGIGLLYGSDQAMVTSKVPYFQDIGIDLTAAAFVVSCMTVSAICGKLLVGYLADKIDLRYVFYVVAFAHIAILVIYLAQPPYWVLLVFATLFGLGIGGVFPVWTTLLAWLFGSKSYGTIMGLMTVILKLFSIVAVRFIGEVHDATGSYVTAFWIFMGAVVVASVLIALLRPERGGRAPERVEDGEPLQAGLQGSAVRT